MKITHAIRSYQQPLHSYLVKGGTRAIEVAHRRWGKDEIALVATCELAHKRIGSFWHCLPLYSQARRALWTSVNPHTGKRRMDEVFPPEIVESRNEQEMFIRFKNQSTWQLIGSDRFDATVGSGPAGIVYSEWALANPSAWAYHRPMLEENGGWALFISTPRGRNHCKDMYDMAVRSPKWFAEVSTIHDTGALSEEQLDESLAEYISLYGEDEGRAFFSQEYECSFNAAILGAYYAREMLAVRSEGRIAEVEALPGVPVHTAWDIGVRDDTSIWWWQIQGTQVVLLDCHSENHGHLESFAELDYQKRQEHGWPRWRDARSNEFSSIDWVPHDAAVREWGTTGGRSRLETMQLLGLNPRLCPNMRKLDGINAVRRTLPRCVFHPRCEDYGIPALEQYARDWDDDKKVFRNDDNHNWASHASDAFRYLALAWQQIPVKDDKPKPQLQPGQVFLPGPPPPRSGRRIAV
jgi:hypothetical protein